MESILNKHNLNEITQADLDEIRLHMVSCKEFNCKELKERYERLFDMVQRYIDNQIVPS